MARDTARRQGYGEATARPERPGRRGARPDGAGNVLDRGDSGKGAANRCRGVGPGSPGLSAPSCFAMAFLWALPSCTQVPQRAGFGPGCLWLAHAFQVSRLRSGRETGEHRREATPCQRLPVKSALLSSACLSY